MCTKLNVCQLFIILILLQFGFPIALSCDPRCNWVSWTDWSQCSRTCGGGLQSRSRGLCCRDGLGFHQCVDECELSASNAYDHRSCNSYCFNGGTFSDSCHCTSGFKGTCCSYDVNECDVDICKNGGSCHNTIGSYYCDCTKHWSGIDCTEDVNECDNGPCMNGMPCVNTNGSFYCNCSNNYGGSLCETDLCMTKPVQLAFLVDSSYSTTSAIFQRQLDFVADVISNVTIAHDKFRVAVLTYSTIGHVDVSFDSYEHKTDLLAQVRNIQYKNGSTHIERGCDEARKAINLSAGSVQFVFLLTDGLPTGISKSIEGIGQLRGHLYRSSGTNQIIIIPFGEDVKHAGLYKMSGDPYFRDILAPFDNDPLNNIVRVLVDSRCSACYDTDTHDVAILVDTSFDLSLRTFYLQLTFLQKLIGKINTYVSENIYQIGQSHVQLGLVTYSNTPEPFMWLNTTYDLEHFAKMVNSLEKYSFNSSSDLSVALKFINDKFLFSGNGARPHARKLVIVLNTGLDSNEAAILNEIVKLKQRGVQIVAIGIGDKVKKEHIFAEASSAYHAYLTDNEISDIYVTLLAKDLIYTHCTDRVNA